MVRERPTVTLQALTVETRLICQVGTDKPTHRCIGGIR